jgi:hypothetical protein
VSDDPSRSYTELEFDTATQARMPRLMFPTGDDLMWSRRECCRWMRLRISGRRRYCGGGEDSGLTRAANHNPQELDTLFVQTQTRLAATQQTDHAGSSGTPPAVLPAAA